MTTNKKSEDTEASSKASKDAPVEPVRDRNQKIIEARVKAKEDAVLQEGVTPPENDVNVPQAS